MNESVNKNKGCEIRPFTQADEGDVVRLWHRAGQATYTYLPTWQAFTLEMAGWVFANIIKPNCDLWVGTQNGQIVAFLAMKGSYIDRLYVDPSVWRTGWGRRLVQFARQLSPQGLELHTHQENWPARTLYEREGFKAVRYGISPPPESAPDVEYHWRPGEPTG